MNGPPSVMGVHALGRRSVFLVNVPIVLVALVRSVVAVRESRDSRAPLPDLPGMPLGALLLFAATYAFVQGGRSGVDAPQVLAAAVAVVALLALGAPEVRRGDTAGRSAGRPRGGRAACEGARRRPAARPAGARLPMPAHSPIARARDAGSGQGPADDGQRPRQQQGGAHGSRRVTRRQRAVRGGSRWSSTSVRRPPVTVAVM
ncbi:hypothetical protein [Streptomyces mexicanus]|uniref:hypothetical protein n=1 Tax=Streptomyces mexicanus TaxID=178566 RepID=UPI00367A0A68